MINLKQTLLTQSIASRRWVQHSPPELLPANIFLWLSHGERSDSCWNMLMTGISLKLSVYLSNKVMEWQGKCSYNLAIHGNGRGSAWTWTQTGTFSVANGQLCLSHLASAGKSKVGKVQIGYMCSWSLSHHSPQRRTQGHGQLWNS